MTGHKIEFCQVAYRSVSDSVYPVCDMFGQLAYVYAPMFVVEFKTHELMKKLLVW